MTERESARKALAEALDDVAGPDEAITVVYDHLPTGFGKQTRVACVRSAGTRRRVKLGCVEMDALLRVETFVRYSANETWGRSEAETALDEMEQAVADVVFGDALDGEWSYDERESLTNWIAYAGEPYLHEEIFVVRRVRG